MREDEFARIIAAMAGAPARFNEMSDGRFDRLERLDATLEDLEQRLKNLQLDEERLRALEQKILHASERRIHDFERRLEHEWLALRQLHEEPLKLLNEHTSSTVETSLNVAREALSMLRARNFESESAADAPVETPQGRAAAPYLRAAVVVLLVAAAALGLLSYRFRTQLNAMEARTFAAEQQASQLGVLVEKQLRGSEQTLQKLSAEALSTAGRAERLANVLAARDVRAYPLRGLRAAAAAEGQAFFSQSRGLVVTASGLPHTSKDQRYQVWMTTTRGVISAGIVAPDALGRVSAVYDIPANMSGTILGVMLSLEPIDGSSKPSGAIVLAS